MEENHSKGDNIHFQVGSTLLEEKKLIENETLLKENQVCVT